MEDYIEERISTVAYEKAREGCEYVTLLDEAIIFGQMIMEILGPNSDLFLKYQTATCLAKAIRLSCAYQLGEEDGFNRAQQNAQQILVNHAYGSTTHVDI